jgi:hypothetical protein
MQYLIQDETKNNFSSGQLHNIQAVTVVREQQHNSCLLDMAEVFVGFHTSAWALNANTSQRSAGSLFSP